MRITINADSDQEAIWGMVFAKQFINQKNDGDGTSESWGFSLNGFCGSVTKKKSGNISVKCKRDQAA